MVAASSLSVSSRRTARISVSSYPNPANASRTSLIPPLPRSPTARGSSMVGRFRRSFNSNSNRSAVFLPTPDTVVSPATSPANTMSTNARGECVAKIAIASEGPMPLVSMSTSNVRRSSRSKKPNNDSASSRTWWCTCKNASVVGSSSPSVRGVTLTT